VYKEYSAGLRTQPCYLTLVFPPTLSPQALGLPETGKLDLELERSEASSDNIGLHPNGLERERSPRVLEEEEGDCPPSVSRSGVTSRPPPLSPSCPSVTLAEGGTVSGIWHRALGRRGVQTEMDGDGENGSG